MMLQAITELPIISTNTVYPPHDNNSTINWHIHVYKTMWCAFLTLLNMNKRLPELTKWPKNNNTVMLKIKGQVCCCPWFAVIPEDRV